MSRSAQDIVSAKQRYKFHRTARYLLALPMVFLLDWWAAALILAVLPFDGALRIAVFVAIFAILDCTPLWYLFKRYKNFKPSKLFVKDPNLTFCGRKFIARRFLRRVFGMPRGGVFLGRACRRLERGICICVRARLSDRFRDLVYV